MAATVGFADYVNKVTEVTQGLNANHIGRGLIEAADRKTSTFKPEIADILFYHDCSEADKAFAHQNLNRQSFAPLGTPVKVSDNIYGAIPPYSLCRRSWRRS